MKKVHWVLGVILSLAVILILLITSFQAVMYADFSFYEREYEKYDVLPDLDMKMEDVMYVTHEMMDYLKGDRENLEVITTVEGKEQDFFNEQDRLHMADVKNLFLGGLALRWWLLGIFALLMLVLIFPLKADWKRVLPRAYFISLGIFLVLTVFLGVLFASDFTKYFTIFHEIFFTNDLWLFDPSTDLMIRMLPEGFFYDMVMRIGLYFLGGLAIFAAAFALIGRFGRKKK